MLNIELDLLFNDTIKILEIYRKKYNLEIYQGRFRELSLIQYLEDIEYGKVFTSIILWKDLLSKG